MSQLPAYVHVLLDGFGETPDPSVERTEMERGMAKQRIINTDVVVAVAATFLFDTLADHAAFMTWYRTDIVRVAFFGMAHPLTGEALQARFVGGDIGTLQSGQATGKGWRRSVKLEYLA